MRNLHLSFVILVSFLLVQGVDPRCDKSRRVFLAAPYKLHTPEKVTVTKKFTVGLKRGFHTLPSGRIYLWANKLKVQFGIVLSLENLSKQYGEKTIGAPVNVLMLEAEEDNILRIRIQGGYPSEVLSELASFLADVFNDSEIMLGQWEPDYMRLYDILRSEEGTVFKHPRIDINV